MGVNNRKLSQNKTLLVNTVPNIAEWSSKDAQPTERATVQVPQIVRRT